MAPNALGKVLQTLPTSGYFILGRSLPVNLGTIMRLLSDTMAWSAASHARL